MKRPTVCSRCGGALVPPLLEIQQKKGVLLIYCAKCAERLKHDKR